MKNVLLKFQFPGVSAASMFASVCSCFCGGEKYETHYAGVKSPTPPPKKVTFDTMVLQHHCAVENRGKPFFHIDRGGKEPPDVSFHFFCGDF